MLEFLFEILGELLLQFVVEALLEIGLHALAEPFRRQPDPRLAALAYACFGGVLGGASLLLVPVHLVSPPWRLANLIVTPLALGLLMGLIGRWRQRRGQEVLRLDRFAYGYLFALTFALLRFGFAH